MALDARNVLNAVIQTLKDNTITIIGSLTTSGEIKLIKRGDARTAPVELEDYPAILVKLVRQDREFSQLAQGGRKKQELNFEIMPLVYSTESYEESDIDIEQICENIVSVLDGLTAMKLSGTALWSLIESIDYFPAEFEGVFASGALINLKTNHLSL